MAFTSREVATGPLQGRKATFLAGEPLCEMAHADQLLAHVSIGVIVHELDKADLSVMELVEKSVSKGIDSLLNMFSSEEPQETDNELIRRMDREGATKQQIVDALYARSGDRSAMYGMLVDDGLDRADKNKPCLQILEHANYKARPLNGVWATAPFLHNGSVPTLSDLLMPVDKRPKTFHVGSKELDPVKVGYSTEKTAHSMLFDTSKKANSNMGHEYGTYLEKGDKDALLEYLKSL